MKCFTFWLALGSLLAVAGRGQCFTSYAPIYAHHSHRCCRCADSCAVEEPFRPSRWGGYLGALGLRDRAGTNYAGMDLEGYYFLTPRWSSGLRGTLTGRMGAAGPATGYGEATRPLLEIFTATWSNALLLLDQPRWRVAALAGAGAGWANLRDADQQVPLHNGRGSCGCTESKLLHTAVSPVGEVGLALTYKLKSPDAPWLTVRGQYRQWYDDPAFGQAGQFSHYLLSVGLTVPDAPSRRR